MATTEPPTNNTPQPADPALPPGRAGKPVPDAAARVEPADASGPITACTRHLPAEPDAHPASAPADEKTRRRAEGFAAKWWAEAGAQEPTDAAMAAVFQYTVRPPKPETYPLIRAAITANTPPVAAAPLYAALAAYETATQAGITSSPSTLHTLQGHLEELRVAAGSGIRRVLRDAADDVEEAWNLLRTARDPRAVDQAHQAVRDATGRARAVIRALAPHAHRMHGTDMPGTAEEIRAAALAYNAVGSTPEKHSAIKTGTPRVRVHCTHDTGTGAKATATITTGVDSAQDFLAAHPAIVVRFHIPDACQDPAANAHRVLGALFRVDVPVEYLSSARG